jgi:hypothetical protein
MRNLIGAGLAAATLVGGGAAMAAPGLEIHHAVARVTVIPEARSDVAVTVVRANPRAPLRITRMGDTVVIDGGLGWRSPNCHSFFGRPGASVWGIGDIHYEDMPQIVVRTPRNVRVAVDGAVFGSIGGGDSVDLANGGCGDWSVADQAGPLTARLAGSGDLRAGSAGSADFKIAGSADVIMRAVRNGLTTAISGSGDVTADAVNGPLHARIAGSGDVRIRGGAVTDMDVAVSGSGDVRFGGVAQSLTAQVSGSGDVSAAHVTGPVTKHVSGSGDVTAGR